MIVVVVAIALVMALKIAGLFGILLVAMMGSVVTVGLTQGSLAPVLPSFSRTTTPLKYWTLIGVCAFGVIVNVANLLLRA